MAKKREGGTFPEPPWSYSPSEVAEWMASTAGIGSRRGARPRRQVRVKGFVGRCPTAAEGKLRHRLEGLGFEAAEGGPRVHRLFARAPSPEKPSAFRGKLGEAGITVRLRKGADLEIRVSFAPRVSYRRASKFLSRLGLRGLEGTWT